MHQAIFANVEIARACAAAPLIGTALRNVVLEAVDAREAALLHGLHLVVDTALFVIQRLQLAGAVVNDPDGRAETQAQSPLADGERILRIFYAAAHHGIDVHVKVGMLGQQLQLLVQNLQALFRDLVGSHVVDRNLQPLESSAIKALNALGHQKIAVRDQSGDHAAFTNARMISSSSG